MYIFISVSWLLDSSELDYAGTKLVEAETPAALSDSGRMRNQAT